MDQCMHNRASFTMAVSIAGVDTIWNTQREEIRSKDHAGRATSPIKLALLRFGPAKMC